MSNPLAIVKPATVTAPEAMIPNVATAPSVAIPALMAIAMGASRDAEFALSLLLAVRKGKVSEKQGFHVDRLVNAHLNPLPVVNGIGIIRYYDAFGDAKRFPKQQAVIEGVEVTLSYTSLFSQKAKQENRGTCTVSSGKFGMPDARYYGRILRDGTFVPGHHITPAVMEWIAALCGDLTQADLRGALGERLLSGEERLSPAWQEEQNSARWEDRNGRA